MDEILAFMQKNGLPLSMPFEDVVAAMERARLESEGLVGAYADLYQKIAEHVTDERVLSDLHAALALRDDTGTTLKQVRMDRAIQRLENDAKDWTPSRGARTHRFEYVRPDASNETRFPVLWVVNVEHDESQHRTFLDAVEAAG